MSTWLGKSRVMAAGLLMVFLVVPVFAQGPAAGSASEFYLKYRTAFDAARKVDELLPYWVAARRKEVESTPAAERADMFDFMKAMGALTDVKIVNEAPTANGATLTVEAVDSDKAKATGTIEMLKEGGAWKVGKERWKSQ